MSRYAQLHGIRCDIGTRKDGEGGTFCVWVAADSWRSTTEDEANRTRCVPRIRVVQLNHLHALSDRLHIGDATWYFAQCYATM